MEFCYFGLKAVAVAKPFCNILEESFLVVGGRRDYS
jgi:hypothetical protein